MLVYSEATDSQGITTAIPNTARDSYEMVQTWVWLLLAIAVIIFLFKFCSWCAQQNRESGSTPSRRLSAVAIIDAAAPQSIACPHCERSEYLGTISDEPPSYGSLPSEYHEDPPPPYSSLLLLPLPAQEQRSHVSNRTEGSSRILHM